MTATPSFPVSAVAVTTAGDDPRRRLRLRLKPKAPTTGVVDGGWWPRSRELAVELPELLAVLAVRLGRVERVTYHLGDWDPTHAKLGSGGGVVRLAGYRSQHPDTVDVVAARQRITLFVVPPDTSPQRAHEALTAAGGRGNTDCLDVLRVSREIHLHAERDAAAQAARQH